MAHGERAALAAEARGREADGREGDAVEGCRRGRGRGREREREADGEAGHGLGVGVRRCHTAAPMLRPTRPPAPLPTARPAAAAAAAPLARRRLLAAAPGLALLLPRPTAAAEAAAPPKTPDPYHVTIPDGWVEAPADRPDGRSRPAARPVVWFPSAAASPDVASAALVTAFASADFTSLGSFGDATAFGENLVASMDRSFSGPGATAATLINARQDVRDGQKVYLIDYDVTRPNDGALKHCFSAVALSFNGVHNRMFTLTATVDADAGGAYGEGARAIVASFVPPPTRY